jgi:hypothetical protein
VVGPEDPLAVGQQLGEEPLCPRRIAHLAGPCRQVASRGEGSGVVRSQDPLVDGH